jgi:hypothetical protein
MHDKMLCEVIIYTKKKKRKENLKCKTLKKIHKQIYMKSSTFGQLVVNGSDQDQPA